MLDFDLSEEHRILEQTIRDFVQMYEIRWDELLVVHDAHPGYVSTAFAQELAGCEKIARS